MAARRRGPLRTGGLLTVSATAVLGHQYKKLAAMIPKLHRSGLFRQKACT
jgi:hypothetical protein